MTNDTFSIVDSVIKSRMSVRAYSNDSIPVELIASILETASQAPSGCNMQPWRVHVLTGHALNRTVDAVCRVFDNESLDHVSEFQHSPEEYFEPYKSRRRKIGFAIYELVGIRKGDKERMLSQHRLNFGFFGAPVGLLFTVHRDLPAASLLGYGAFLQNIMLSAQAHGLGTCFQTAWCDYHRVIGRELKFNRGEMLIGGMAIGFADNDAPVNTLQTERMQMSEFATFHNV